MTISQTSQCRVIRPGLTTIQVLNHQKQWQDIQSFFLTLVKLGIPASITLLYSNYEQGGVVLCRPSSCKKL